MSDNKDQPPTDRRLEKAREDGEVANSPDVTAVVSFVVVLCALTAFSAWFVQRLNLVVGIALGNGADGGAMLSGKVYSMLVEAILLCVPLALTGALGGIFGVAVQGAVTMAFKKVELNFSAVDPIAGFKRIFSSQTLVEVAKLIIKVLLFSAVLWLTTRSILPIVVGGMTRPPLLVSQLLWEVLVRLIWTLAIFMGALAIVDYKLQKWLFIRGKRMSHEDIKREAKEQNGNPEIKQKQREFAQELLDGPIGGKQKPDVVLVNPTHFSVALSFCGGQSIPLVVEKGQDKRALLIRQWAESEAIPVVEQPALARRLFLTAVGDPVPADCYQAVAIVLQWVRAIGRNEASMRGS